MMVSLVAYNVFRTRDGADYKGDRVEIITERQENNWPFGVFKSCRVDSERKNRKRSGNETQY